MSEPKDDTRQAAILDAAWQCFASYGFRKTAMDDIARAAGMSRPALYQHYRNKEDIFRSLAQNHFDEVAIAVRAALAKPGSAGTVLAEAFTAQGGRLIEAMVRSPHGMELIDTSRATSGDIAEAGEARLSEIYRDWLAAGQSVGRIDFEGSPEQVAATIAAALKGLKSAAKSFSGYQASLRRFAHLIGAGLEAAASSR
ncbi:TetR/AcrR family transcriptional regulator [Seohaeicola zhoushanensis]|uniref:TetR family transcriptional regulator n=1 Tax=Seohaeicola zhoushanensis TaxID=1569283 RepID=A0A8J3H0K8_9RHOB|nr:TetR/AcrR family transcriptional regulator [Seohaeicola zhoushanensis]GHF60168.1 TetR family transcriptional regulator [Seohaeicola zhoushanensis]